MIVRLAGESVGESILAVRRVGNDRPFVWLQRAWEDLRRAPVPSLAYGLLFAICGDIVLLLALPHPHLVMTAISGFFLVAPLLAAGLYEISRRIAEGREVTFISSLDCWRTRAQPLFLLGLLLGLVAFAWERLSSFLFALVFGIGATSLSEAVGEITLAGEHTLFVATWFIVGGLLALLVFAATAVSVPMLVERKTGLATAIVTSVRVVLANLDAMFLWALIIVGLTLLGFATFLFGLIVFMPLIGHATWHAYRDLVAEPGAR